MAFSLDTALQQMAGWATSTAASVTTFDKAIRSTLPVSRPAPVQVVDVAPPQTTVAFDWKIAAAVGIIVLALFLRRRVA